MAVVETLEVHFVEINPRVEILEDLGCPIPIRDESGFEAAGSGFLEHGDGPLAGDQRLVVSADEGLRALAQCVADQDLRRRAERWRDRVRVAQSLRGDPILTVRAVEVAAEHPEAVSQGPRIGVEEGFLFNRVALHPTHVTPGNVELAAAVESDFTNPRQSVRDGASVPARVAAHAITVELLVELALAHATVNDIPKRRAASCHGALNLYFTPASALKESFR